MNVSVFEVESQRKWKRLCFFFHYPVYAGSLFRPIHLLGLGAYLDLFENEKTLFPKLCANLSMGAFCSTGRFLLSTNVLLRSVVVLVNDYAHAQLSRTDE